MGALLTSTMLHYPEEIRRKLFDNFVEELRDNLDYDED
jgi:hypothetical protein